MITVALLLLLLLAIGTCLYVIGVGYGIFFGAPYVGTNTETARAMLRMGHANSRDVVLDLGCGIGNILVIAAKEFHVKKVIGYDVNGLLVLIARLRFFFLKKQGIDCEYEFHVLPISKLKNHEDSTLVTLYLLPSLMMQIQLNAVNLPVDVKIVSHGFAFAGGKPEREERIHNAMLRLYTRNGVMPHDYERGNRT